MALDSANRAKIAESALISSLRDLRSKSWQSIKILRFARKSQNLVRYFPSLRGDLSPKQSKNPCEAPETRPLRGAKNREQGCSSASADFLLEAEKARALPLKAKSGCFWRVGGVGRGVQPFLRKKTSESNAENGENIIDSAICAKNAESKKIKYPPPSPLRKGGGIFRLPRFCYANAGLASKSRNDGK
ncbi:hypothetical protein ACWIUD_00970 [Helicobacter sp. 23-1044]